jgi:hypothetical protein
MRMKMKTILVDDDGSEVVLKEQPVTDAVLADADAMNAMKADAMKTGEIFLRMGGRLLKIRRRSK